MSAGAASPGFGLWPILYGCRGQASAGQSRASFLLPPQHSIQCARIAFIGVILSPPVFGHSSGHIRAFSAATRCFWAYLAVLSAAAACARYVCAFRVRGLRVCARVRLKPGRCCCGFSAPDFSRRVCAGVWAPVVLVKHQGPEGRGGCCLRCGADRER